jgi:hypothetical protein
MFASSRCCSLKTSSARLSWRPVRLISSVQCLRVGEGVGGELQREERAGWAGRQAGRDDAAACTLPCSTAHQPVHRVSPAPAQAPAPAKPSPAQPSQAGPVADGPVRERLEEGQQVEEVVDGGAAVAVGRPVAQRLGQALALGLELVDLEAAGGGRAGAAEGRGGWDLNEAA